MDAVVRFMRVAWRRWKALAHLVITAQNRVLMTLAYVVAVMPVALYLRARGRVLVPTELGPDDATSYWEPRTDGPMTMERANRMF